MTVRRFWSTLSITSNSSVSLKLLCSDNTTKNYRGTEIIIPFVELTRPYFTTMMEDEGILLEFLSRLPQPLIPIEVSRVLIKIQESELLLLIIINNVWYLSLQSTDWSIPTSATAGSATLCTAVPGRFTPWLSSSSKIVGISFTENENFS